MRTHEDLLADLRRALDFSGNIYDVSDIIAAVKSGEMQWWSGPKEQGFCITSISVFPRKKILDCVALWGDKDDILSIQDRIVEFGRTHGCSYFVAEGRLGWKKVLPNHGWEQVMPRVSIDLESGKEKHSCLMGMEING